MSKEFRRGLIVGKFCPLHRGHEHAIRKLIERCEEPFILSYTNPEFSDCEPEKRRHWLTKLFPEARVLVLDAKNSPPNAAEDREHRRFVGQVCRERLGTTVDAVFTSEAYGEGFATELTEYFRETDPRHPKVRHVSIDANRSHYPISGTLIREDIHAHRQWLSPVVYASYVQRICLLGGESSGKSTLAAALAQRFQTEHVPEYGRELWERQDGTLTFSDLTKIARVQIAREETAAPRAHRFLFCDTSPLTTRFYSREMFGTVADELMQHARREYALHVLCAPDFPFVQDGTRRDNAFRLRQHAWYREQLANRGVRWMQVQGPMAARVARVEQELLGTAR